MSMDVTEHLQTYAAQLVALGQATLAHHRRGEALPEALAALAVSLVALEDAFAPATVETPARATDAAAAAPTAPATEEPATEPPPAAEVAPPWPDFLTELAATDVAPFDVAPTDEAPTDVAPADVATTEATTTGVAPADIGAMSPVEADAWLPPLEEASNDHLFITETEATAAAGEEPLVIDVEEEEGGGPEAIVVPSDALPPLVIDPTSVPLFETSSEDYYAPAAKPAAVEDAPESPGLRFCTNCGTPLRPGRRFCHVCGASVAEMVAELYPAAATPAPEPPPPAAEPPPAAAPATFDTSAAMSEWPTMVGELPRYDDAPLPPPAGVAARFCNNCGLAITSDVTVCPDCGSRDIS